MPLTEKELARYKVYCKLLELFDMVPKDFKAWLIEYKRLEKRRLRKERLEKQDAQNQREGQ